MDRRQVLLIIALGGAALPLLSTRTPLAAQPIPSGPGDFVATQLGAYELRHDPALIVDVAAETPLVDRPIMADFDPQGRLYVADSSGSNAPVREQVKNPTHRIVRLEDTDGDGRFDRATPFAEDMMFPEGILYHDGSVYCAAPPQIWKLTDIDDDGRADRREVWFDGKTLTGCANDLHGPYLGPEGWIYWCKGAFAKQTYHRPGLPTISDSAAHVFRMRPDGDHFDSVMSGGMDNPVEVAFTPDGEPIFTTTFYSHPRQGNRDALVHAVYGGVFPKEHGVLNGLVRTGPLLPPLTHLGPAVPSGLVRVRSSAFGDDWQDALISTQFNLRRIQAHRLVESGATYQSDNVTLLSSNHPDFHPTDVLEDADGSLLVVNTGGWYKLCCPSSQLAKPEELGAIYRLRPRGESSTIDPRGRRLDWARLDAKQLWARLDDPRPQVRSSAARTLEARGDAVIPALESLVRQAALAYGASGGPAETRQLERGLWTLGRIATPNSRATLRRLLPSLPTTGQRIGVHVLGIWRDRQSVDLLCRLAATSNDLHLLRKTATALGQIGDPSAAETLLQIAETVPMDRFLEHAVIYALVSLEDTDRLRQALASSSSATRRVAFIALMQCRPEAIRPADFQRLIAEADEGTLDTIASLLIDEPRWLPTVLPVLADLLRQAPLPDREFRRWVGVLAAYSNHDAQAFLSSLSRNPALPGARRQAILEAVPRWSAEADPQGIWRKALAELLRDPENRIGTAAIDRLQTSKTTPLPLDLQEGLRSLASDPNRPAPLRLEAWRRLARSPQGLPGEGFEAVAHWLRQHHQPDLQRRAVRALTEATLSPGQLERLIEPLADLAPHLMNDLLPHYQSPAPAPLRGRLMARLAALESPAGLRTDLLERCADGIDDPDTLRSSKALLRRLDADPEARRQRLESTLSTLPPGNVSSGQRVFLSEKTACYRCHEVGYVGGDVGPDLTRIGSVRSRVDLLESILFPDASFVRSYEPVVLSLRDGTELSGIVASETDDQLTLRSANDELIVVSQRDVDQRTPGRHSTMPSGLDAALSMQELADLLAFLESMR